MSSRAQILFAQGDQNSPSGRSVESHLWTEGEAEENKDFHPLQCPVGSGHGGLLTRAVPKDHKKITKLTNRAREQVVLSAAKFLK